MFWYPQSMFTSRSRPQTFSFVFTHAFFKALMPIDLHIDILILVTQNAPCRRRMTLVNATMAMMSPDTHDNEHHSGTGGKPKATHRAI